MRKFRKLSRYWSARLKFSPNLPFYWHIGNPNFGDDFNPMLFGLISGTQVRLERRRDRLHFLGMGSLLDRACAGSTIVGSGLLKPFPKPHADFRDVISVRGALSREQLIGAEAALLGDPMVLLDQLVSFRCDKSGPIGFIPHFSELKKAKGLGLAGVKIINPAVSPWRVIREIAGCSKVFSQSLHGLIVADSLGVPNQWVTPGKHMIGGCFKFDDYFSTLDSPKEARPFERATFMDSNSNGFSVGKFIHDKRELLDATRSALSLLSSS